MKGVVKMTIYGDPKVSVSMICEQIFGGRNETKEMSLIDDLGKFLKLAATESWSLEIMKEKLNDIKISAEHAEVLTKVWNSERYKILRHAKSSTKWTGSLESTAWRIDVKTATKKQDEMNKPVALFEFNVKANQHASKDEFQFELDSEELAKVLKKFDSIASAIDKKSKRGR